MGEFGDGIIASAPYGERMQARAVHGCDLEARGGLEVGAWVAFWG